MKDRWKEYFCELLNVDERREAEIEDVQFARMHDGLLACYRCDCG